MCGFAYIGILYRAREEKEERTVGQVNGRHITYTQRQNIHTYSYGTTFGNQKGVRSAYVRYVKLGDNHPS